MTTKTWRTWPLAARGPRPAVLAHCAVCLLNGGKKARGVCNSEKKRRGVSGMYRPAELHYTIYTRGSGIGVRGGRLLSCPTDVSPRESIARPPSSPPPHVPCAPRGLVFSHFEIQFRACTGLHRSGGARYAQFRDNDPPDGRSVSCCNWPEEGWPVRLLRLPFSFATAFVGAARPHFLSW